MNCPLPVLGPVVRLKLMTSHPSLRERHAPDSDNQLILFTHDLSDCFKDGYIIQVGPVGLKTIDFAVTIGKKKVLFH